MGLTESSTAKIVNAIKNDNIVWLKQEYTKNNVPLNIEVTKKPRTWILLCAYFNSPKCLEYLIDSGNDINIVEKHDNTSALIVASKFNYVKIWEILVTHNPVFEHQDAYGLNALTMAFIRGNYDSCYFLLENTPLKLDKTWENYSALNETLNYPMFSMELFYNCLINKIPCDKVPSFAIPNKRDAEFLGKVPDPNETWKNFLIRLGRFELYQPPLVSQDSVQPEKKKSIYMKVQSGWCQWEYPVEINLNTRENQDIEMQDQKPAMNTRNDEKIELNIQTNQNTPRIEREDFPKDEERWDKPPSEREEKKEDEDGDEVAVDVIDEDKNNNSM